MQALGDQFLARPAFSDHKHGTVERRGAACPLDRVEKGKTLPDELIGPLHSPDNWCLTPPIGKMFHQKNRRKCAVCSVFSSFGKSGTTLVWYEAVQACYDFGV